MNSIRECPICGDIFRRRNILGIYTQCVCGAVFTRKLHPIPMAQESYFTGFLTPEYIGGQVGFGEDLDRLYRSKGTMMALEIGCGVGTVLSTMAQKGWNCTGIDNSAEGVKKAKELHPEVNFACCDFLDYPALNNERDSFGLIISNNTIEHFHEPRYVFLKAWEILEAGGIFSVQTPSTAYWIDRNLPWIHACETTYKGEHTVLFDQETLICLAVQCGFTVERIHDNPGPENIWIDFKKRWL